MVEKIDDKNVVVLDGDKSDLDLLLDESNGVQVVPIEDEELKQDLKYIRDKHFDLIAKMEEVVHVSIEVAKQSDSEKYITALATLVKEYSNVQKNFLEIARERAYAAQPKEDAKTKEDKSDSSTKSQKTNISANQVFIGSTADYLKQLEEKDAIGKSSK